MSLTNKMHTSSQSRQPKVLATAGTTVIDLKAGTVIDERLSAMHRGMHVPHSLYQIRLLLCGKSAGTFSNPGPSHVATARRVLRYLAGTRSLGITYRRSGQDATVAPVGGNVLSNTLTVSADADHAGAKDRQSVNGWALMLN